MQKFKKAFLSSAPAAPEMAALHSGEPTISFDLTKINKYGKKQSRKLTLSEKGVSNSVKNTAKWFVKADVTFHFKIFYFNLLKKFYIKEK
jgi:hypothetical protein